MHSCWQPVPQKETQASFISVVFSSWNRIICMLQWLICILLAAKLNSNSICIFLGAKLISNSISISWKPEEHADSGEYIPVTVWWDFSGTLTEAMAQFVYNCKWFRMSTSSGWVTCMVRPWFPDRLVYVRMGLATESEKIMFFWTLVKPTV